MLDPRRIAIFGDWHRNVGWAITAIRSAALEGTATMLHVGDFGMDWPGPKRGRYEDKRPLCQSRCSGVNHDNWETVNELPVDGDGTAFARSNIRVLPRGGRAQVEGLLVGALGGAFSVD